MNLYQINQEYLFIQQLLESSDGEIDQDVESHLIIGEKDFQQKAKAYRGIILKFRSDLEAAKIEAERIKKFKESREKAIERLERNLDESLKLRELTELDFGVEGKISYRKSSSVVVDEESLPKEYFNSKVVETPDKKRIKEAIDNGEEVNGAYIQINQNIQIK